MADSIGRLKWGPQANDAQVQATEQAATVDPDGNRDGAISRSEVMAALDTAVDLAKFRACHDQETVAVTLDGRGRIVVADTGHAQALVPLLTVDPQGNVSNRTVIFRVQGELNRALRYHGTIGPQPWPLEQGDLCGAGTEIVTNDPNVTVSGVAVVHTGAEALAETLDSHGRYAVAGLLMPGAAGEACVRGLRDTFRAFGDQEGLAYCDKLAKLPNAAELTQQLETMLNTPYELSNPELHGSISAYALVKAALHDIAFPANIGQEYVGSCAATVEQIKLAHENPGVYLSLLHGLAKDGLVRLPNRQMLTANYSFLTATHKDEARSPSCCLMQNAIMAFAKDKPDYDSGDEADDGLDDTEIQRFRSAVSPDEPVTFVGGDTPKERQQGWKRLTNTVQHGEYVSVGIRYSDSGRDTLHQVLVTGVSAKQVTYVNPWGRLETMPTAAFQKRLDTAAVPAGSRPIHRSNARPLE